MTDDTQQPAASDNTAMIALPAVGMRIDELFIKIRSEIDSIQHGDQENALNIRNAVRALLTALKPLGKQADDALRDYLITHGEDGKPLEITVGTVKYYVARKKVTKPKLQPAEMVSTLMCEFGGEEDKFTQCLSANAFKPGQIKALLEDDDVYDTMFETTYPNELQTKPEKSLQVVDTKFLR